MKKTLDDLQTALEEKDKMLRNAEYERDLLEKEKVLYDTQVKVGSFERPLYNVASLALFMQNCQNTSIKPSRLPLCHNKEGSIVLNLLYLQDLQRRLDLERAERNKTDSATLKLLSELKEDSQKANELRDQESRQVKMSCYKV